MMYRAVWNDDRANLMAEVQTRFSGWLASKGIDLEVPYTGTASIETDGGSVEVVSRRTEVGGVRALQLELIEERQPKGERWTTLVRVLIDPDGTQWLWVDNSQVADDLAAKRVVGAPRLVRDLIESGIDARVDQVRLTAEPAALDAQSIGGLVRNHDRSLPLIVFSHDPAFDEGTTIARARMTHRALAGAVQVYILPTSQEASLRRILGDDLTVWGGAARLYLPNRDARGLRPDRHRYVLPARMERHQASASRIFIGMLASVITARRPPASFEVVRRDLWGGGESNEELILYADQEIDRLREDRDSLRLQVEILDEEVFTARSDLLESEAEITRLQQQLALLWQGTRDRQGSPVHVDATDVTPPVTVGAAIDRAINELSHVVIHPDAGRDLEDIDGHDNGPAWASKIWRGLQALDAYGKAGFDGNFKAWCTKGDDPLVWPATDKKLAMRESESVQSNERFRRQRILPVASEVDPSGQITMWSHLKISEGGGRLAPRVYFHDDTRGPTGRVHVGFIGPHHYMENTRTN